MNLTFIQNNEFLSATELEVTQVSLKGECFQFEATLTRNVRTLKPTVVIYLRAGEVDIRFREGEGVNLSNIKSIEVQSPITVIGEKI